MPVKDFYTIKDFYNYIRKSENVPTTHRHFVVQLHPCVEQASQQLAGSAINFRGGTETFPIFDNDFFERFSMAIQSITLPTQFNIATQNYQTPLGNWNAADGDSWYGKINNPLTFNLMDQMEPLFEKHFNQWMYMCQNGYSSTAEMSCPKVNIIIKYFKQNEVYEGNYIEPNFIYYFTNAFPTQIQTCSIDHSGNDSEGDLRRTVVFSYNTMLILNNATFAAKYKLEHLFNKVCIGTPRYIGQQQANLRKYHQIYG